MSDAPISPNPEAAPHGFEAEVVWQSLQQVPDMLQNDPPVMPEVSPAPEGIPLQNDLDYHRYEQGPDGIIRDVANDASAAQQEREDQISAARSKIMDSFTNTNNDDGTEEDSDTELWASADKETQREHKRLLKEAKAQARADKKEEKKELKAQRKAEEEAELAASLLDTTGITKEHAEKIKTRSGRKSRAARLGIKQANRTNARQTKKGPTDWSTGLHRRSIEKIKAADPSLFTGPRNAQNRLINSGQYLDAEGEPIQSTRKLMNIMTSLVAWKKDWTDPSEVEWDNLEAALRDAAEKQIAGKSQIEQDLYFDNLERFINAQRGILTNTRLQLGLPSAYNESSTEREERLRFDRQVSAMALRKDDRGFMQVRAGALDSLRQRLVAAGFPRAEVEQILANEDRRLQALFIK